MIPTVKDEAVSEISVPARRRDRHWGEYIATAGALVISTISLWVAIGTEDANRKMVAAATLPLLQSVTSDTDASDRNVLTFGIVNSGVGPALVETFEVFWKKKPMKAAQELLSACCAYKAGEVVWTRGTVGHTVIRAGEERLFISYPAGVRNKATYDALHTGQQGDITERVCYCSVFNECWLTFLNTLHPARVEHCPAPKVGFH